MNLSESQPHDMVGRSIGGCTIMDLIGQGAVGDVFRAKQISLNRIVAIKVLARELNRNTALIKRFQREAHAVAQLSHQNIASVYDFGCAGETYYIVMEYVDGKSLDGIIQEAGRLEPPVALSYILQAAGGIAHAQKANILHRDIKPGNLLVSKEGVVKVVDFGLAKTEAETSSPDLTSLGAMLGTPNYMSPEQCGGGRVTPASDVYCLGGTFYRILTGQTCFPSNNPVAVMVKHQSEEPLPPYLFRADLPAGYSEVIMKTLAKRPEDRYLTAEELVSDLKSLGDGRPPKAAASGFGAPPVHPGFLDDSQFILGALQMNFVGPDQIRTAIQVQEQLREIEVEERLYSILLKKGYVEPEKVDLVFDAIRRTRRQQVDQAFLTAAQERGLVTPDRIQWAQQTLLDNERAGRSEAACHILTGKEYISFDEVAVILRGYLEKEQTKEEVAFRNFVARMGLAKVEAMDALLAGQRSRRARGVHYRLDQLVVSEGILTRSKIHEIFQARLLALFSRDAPAAGGAAANPPAAAASAARLPRPSEEQNPAKKAAGTLARRSGSILPSMSSFKMEGDAVCPFCRKQIPVASLFCPFCMHKLDRSQSQPPPKPQAPTAGRQPSRPAPALGSSGVAAAKPAGSVAATPPPGGVPVPHGATTVKAGSGAWAARLPNGQITPPLNLETMGRLIAEKKITRETPVLTPASQGRWTRAGSVRELARSLGVCHACQKPVAAGHKACPHCKAER